MGSTVRVAIDGRLRGDERSRFWWRLQQRAVPYLFIAPFFVIFMAFFMGPGLFALYAGFHDWTLLSKMKFVGLKNFRLLFRDATLWLSVRNTLFYFVFALLVQWPLALMLAVILNQKSLRGRRVLTPVYFIPVLTSSAVVAIVFVLFLDKDYGLFNAPLIALGFKAINWLGTRELSKSAVALLLIWRWVGYNMVLFLASLQSIPQELYEAAWVDGAGRVQTFFSITIPMLRPTIAYVLIMGAISSLHLFEEPWILTRGGPADSSLSVGNYLYRVSVGNLRMGYGAALGLFLFIPLLAFSTLQMRLFRVYRED